MLHGFQSGEGEKNSDCLSEDIHRVRLAIAVLIRMRLIEIFGKLKSAQADGLRHSEPTRCLFFVVSIMIGLYIRGVECPNIVDHVLEQGDRYKCIAAIQISLLDSAVGLATRARHTVMTIGWPKQRPMSVSIDAEFPYKGDHSKSSRRSSVSFPASVACLHIVLHLARV
jgi:hypothetical protein